MARVVSDTSSFSSGNLPIICSNPSPFKTTDEERRTAYRHALQIVLLEYSHEPRFQKQYMQQGALSERKDVSNITLSMTQSNRDPMATTFSEEQALNYVLTLLREYIYKIIIREVDLQNENLRRSYSRFYGNILAGGPPSAMTVEELIMQFSKAASNELCKLPIKDVSKEVTKETEEFVNFLLSLVPKEAPTLSQKIKNIRDIQKVRKPVSNRRPLPRQQLDGTQINRPNFTVSSITHAKYFANLFEVEDDYLQRDIDVILPNVTSKIYCWELSRLSNNLKKGKGSLSRNDFHNEREYNSWKNYEQGEIASQLDRFGVESRDLASMNFPNIIPQYPRETFVALLCFVFRKECPADSKSINLSQAAMFFLTKCSKYWRVDFPTTLAALVYSAANKSILSQDFLNPELTENLFSMIRRRILKSDDNIDTSIWNTTDRDQWILNLLTTGKQCINSLCGLISQLYEEPKPTFSPILRFYFQYIEEDPFISSLLESNKFTEKSKWIKKLRKKLKDTSVDFYMSQIRKIPRDNTIEFQHYQDVVESIYRQIKLLQKKYSKPLLDMINIPVSCADILLKVFCTDVVKILGTIEKKGKKDSLGPSNALDLYKSMKDLRFIYVQVETEEDFPIKLEDFFNKYLRRLCNEATLTEDKIIKKSLKDEKWESIHDDARISFSVTDIFKSINQNIKMFQEIEWGDEYQIAKVLTKLLNSFLDGLQFYSKFVLDLIQRDMQGNSATMAPEGTTRTTEKNVSARPSSTLLHGLRKVVGGSSSSSSSNVPPPYQYKVQTCVMLNDLYQMKSNISTIEDLVNPERLSSIIKNHEKSTKTLKRHSSVTPSVMHQFYTIRVVEANDIKGFSNDGLSNTSVTLQNIDARMEIGSTQIIHKSVNPKWDQEFEVDLPYNKACSISIKFWHHPTNRFKSLGGDEICGTAMLTLDPKRFKDDGYPNDVSLPLNDQGMIYLQVSLESEKDDVSFSLGKSYRTLDRTCDRVLDLIVEKFTLFIKFSFSRETLVSLHGSEGTNQVTEDQIGDAIVPLYNYIDLNLNILGSGVSTELLNAIILKVWLVIMTSADFLMLPSLSTAEQKHRSKSSRMSLWGGHSHDISGYGRPLTFNEIKTIFRWLRSISVDFLYNNGQGPPLKELHNHYYENLQIILKYYDKNVHSLKKKVEKLMAQLDDQVKKLAW